MNRWLPSLIFVFFGLACGSEPVRRPPREDGGTNDVTLSRVEVRPASTMLSRASTVSLSATAVFSDGKTEDVTTRATWSSVATDIATVDAAGVVTAVSAGSAEIRATFEGVSGAATIVVPSATLIAIDVEPASSRLDPGDTVTLTARGRFEDGTSSDITSSVEWISSDEAVARVAGGVVTAVAPGPASIGAREPISGVSGSASITVNSVAPTSVSVDPSGVMLPLGLTQQYRAFAMLPNGSEVDVTTEVQWVSSSTVVATISNLAGSQGLVTSVAEGITSITAIHPLGPRGSVTLVVTRPALMTLTITPTSAAIATGQRQAFRATATFTNGTMRDLTNVVTWESSNTNVAQISNAGGARGIATPVGTGTTSISAIDPMSGADTDLLGTSAVLTVVPPRLTGIVVTPSDRTIPFGSMQQYRADGLYSDNSSADITAAVEWRSSNAQVATIAAGGLASSVGQGMTMISAVDPVSGVSSDITMNGTARLTVSPPALISIQVTPSIWAMVVNSTQQFTATGRFSDGMTRNITNTVTWSSSGPAVTVNATGLATGRQAGSARIIAVDPASMVSSETTNESGSVTVSLAQLVSIRVTPTATTAPPGADVRFRATGTYDNGATSDLTNAVVWTSRTASVAQIGNVAGARGVAFNTAAGMSRITAREPGTGIDSNNSGGSAMLTVNGALQLNSISINPRTASVNIGRTLQLNARGVFSDGQPRSMNNSVVWSSSNQGAAIVSNTEGTRGIVTGQAVGMTTVSAVHTASGIGSAGLSAAITVNVGIVTLSQSWNGPTVEIDASGDFGVNVGSVMFNAGQFGPGAVITDVNIAINFLKTDGTCASPAPGGAFHNETSFRLQGPTGLQVILASANTWTTGTAISPVTITFDQAAAAPPNNTPVTGTYQPNGGNLNMFNGTMPAGTWILQAGDNAGADPLCVMAYTVTITAQ